MKKQLLLSISFIILPLLFVSCISSIFKEKAPTFSDEIILTNPEPVFQKMQTSVYPSWKSTHTNNVISAFSDCNENIDRSLSMLHQYVSGNLESLTTIENQLKEIAKRPALFRTVSGKLDGQDIQVRSVSFIKNNCGYVLSLSGRPEKLQADQSAFEAFLQGVQFK